LIIIVVRFLPIISMKSHTITIDRVAIFDDKMPELEKDDKQAWG